MHSPDTRNMLNQHPSMEPTVSPPATEDLVNSTEQGTLPEYNPTSDYTGQENNHISLECVGESNVVSYANTVYGIPDEYIVLKGERLVLDTADDMNAILNSKSPKGWVKVRTHHMWVVRSNQMHKPNEGTSAVSELEYESFLYIQVCVKTHPSDSAVTIQQGAHDSRRLVPVHKPLAQKLLGIFLQLKSLTPEKKRALEPLLTWKMPTSTPQVNPLVANWPAYPKIKLETAFVKHHPTKRLLRGESTVLQSPGQRPCNTTTAESVQAAVTGLEAELDTDLDEVGTSSTTLRYKRVRSVDVADGAKTHVYVQADAVYIIEHV